MSNLLIIFATGLTAGGLSCLAVQGGMLASAIAPASGAGSDTATNAVTARVPGSARPILLFLAAKLVAYTILGAALGWLGSLLQLTPNMRAGLQIAVGLFMLGTALRLLNVHPIFRHFVIEPPKAVTRYIRRRSRQSDGSWLAPTFLGALTVLIPCGVTQAMMALAVASGTPVAGALVMLAFVLGTTPLFFSLAYLATKLGERWQSRFWKATGAVVLVLGLVAVDGGLALLGSPLSSASVRQSLAAGVRQSSDQPGPGPAPAAAVATASNELTMNITDQAYTPAVMEAKAGQPIKLTLKTVGVSGCARALVIPSLNLEKILGETDSQTIVIPAQPAGALRLTCSMGMYSAQINVK